MKKFYCKVYSPSEGTIEEFLIFASDDREAVKGMISYLALKILRGEDAYPEDAKWAVKPLWMAYRSGELENAEVSLLEVFKANDLMRELETELKKKPATNQATFAAWG